MKILIDIGHPAHVHLFRNTIDALKSKGHNVFVTARDKDVTHKLLEIYKINYQDRPSSSRSIINKIFGIFKIVFVLWKFNKRFQADIMIGGVGNVYIAILGFISRKPSIIFDDTEHSKYEMFLVKLFSSIIITPDCYLKSLGHKQIKYSGYHELAYLHPNYFKSDMNIYDLLGISKCDTYCILRFVSWGASHDIGHSGMSDKTKNDIVDYLSKYFKLFISSENELPSRLKQYELNINPDYLHRILKEAYIYIGEGSTTASECAVLGTPNIYINSLSVGYCKEQEEKYGLCVHLINDNNLLNFIKNFLENVNLLNDWQKRRELMLFDKIDVTAFFVWFIENYPNSKKIMKENPDYQYNFK